MTWQVTGNGISCATAGWPWTLETVSVTGSSYQSQRKSSLPLVLLGSDGVLQVSEAQSLFFPSDCIIYFYFLIRYYLKILFIYF